MTDTIELAIRFARLDKDAPFDTPVPFTAHFEGSDTETFRFVNPLGDRTLADLRWYIESYWRWPVGPDYDRAQEIEAQLPQYGCALFDAVFKPVDAMRLFERFDGKRQAGATLTIDTTEPRILRLPWELLCEEGGYLFSKRPPVNIRRRMHKVARLQAARFDLPVRILMVTCRPEGAGFIDPRSSARPLLDALDELGDQAEVEFLRPPTLAALAHRLRDPQADPVHVVHFDGHGVYDPVVGLGFLLFEDDVHQKDPVDAERLGTLLNECGIPLVILDACQSARPDDRNPFGSVASRLIESGVGGVVAMNYSVLVETSRRLTGHFYRALAGGMSVSAALDAARFELLADTKRLTLYRPEKGEEEEIIRLQDWFVPALYQQPAELVPFAPRPPAPSPAWRARGRLVPTQPARVGFPPEPQHGFQGRARELLDLERAFADHGIVVLHGFGGQGKTALACHTARWLARTCLFERAAFVSFEGGAGLDVVLAELGNALVSDDFAIHEGEPAQAIADALAEKATLVVWDNFESILPDGDVPLPADALKALLDAGARWFAPDESYGRGLYGRGSYGRGSYGRGHRAPTSRLLITTRDDLIPHPAYAPGRNCLHTELKGLDRNDALELAAQILRDRNLPRPPRESLSQLMDFLGGHPLSIQLVLPHLRQTPNVDRLMDEFETLLPGFKQGEGKERNQSLEVSLRFSLRRLGAEAQAVLPRLAVFQGGANEEVLLRITEIDRAVWEQIKPELAHAALIRLEDLPGVTMLYLHFHPTLAPHLARQLTSEQTDQLKTRYWQAYYAFASFLYHSDDRTPIQARALAVREMPNLRRALKLALDASALDEAVEFADSINRFLNYFGRWRERDEVTESVRKAMEGRGAKSEGRLTKSEFVMKSQQGEVLLQQGRAREAEQVFRALLARRDAGAEYDADDARYDMVGVRRHLALSFSGQGKPTAAIEQYHTALRELKVLEKSPQVQRAIGLIHADLADVLTDMGQYAAAEQEYNTALKTFTEIDDPRNMGVVNEHLGTLALRQGQLQEASQRYKKSLALYSQIGEDGAEAIAWHQLGRVAEEAREWDEAERCYKESLAIEERLGHLAGAAQTCNQLAIVAKGAGRPDEAERWCRRAIEMFEKLGSKRELAAAANNLADLLLAQGRLDEAEAYAHRVREIKETLDLSAETWMTYNILAQIAERRGRADEARQWRRKEQETFAAFAGSEQQIQQFQPLIQAVALAANGNPEALAFVEGEYPKMAAGGNEWVQCSEAIRRLIAGERDIYALTDNLTHVHALIIRRILAVLAGEGEPPPSPSPLQGEGRGNGESEREHPSPTGTRSGGRREAEGQGLTLPQLLDLVERAARGDPALGGQLFATMEQMAQDPAQPPELRALGKVLLNVLAGETSPDLDGLPPELASAVRGLLARLRN